MDIYFKSKICPEERGPLILRIHTIHLLTNLQ